MAKKLKKEIEIELCPNCGAILSGSEFLTSFEKLPNEIALNFDPLSGRFLCPRCNYSGYPIKTNQEDYSKLKFENKKILPPISNQNPFYAKGLLVLFLLGIFSLILSYIFFGTAITILLSLIFSITILIFGISVPKFKK